MQSKRNEDLFVLDTDRKDTAASNKARREAKAKEDSKKRKHEYSALEMRKIQKVLNIHGKEGAIALAERGKAGLGEKRIRKHMKSSASNTPTFDLWNHEKSESPNQKVASDPKFDKPTNSPARLSKKQIKAFEQAKANAPPKLAVEVAHPGQSYRPDREQHQESIGEALAIEIRRNEAVEYKATPISEGMSAITRDILVASDFDEDSSDDDDDEKEEINDAVTTRIIKREGKLTRAQRNKQKRVKAEEVSLKKRRLQKQFLHEANEVHVKRKAMQRAVEEQRQGRAEIAVLKSEKEAQPLGKDVWTKSSEKDPISAPSLPVALTEELNFTKDGRIGGGGLRTVTPKGSLVTDRIESMVMRKMIVKKREGRRIVQGKRRPKRRGAQGTEYLLV